MTDNSPIMKDNNNTTRKATSEETTREELFREKARTYTICFTATCPLREHCLRALLTPYMPTDLLVTTSINLAHPQTQTMRCPMYRSDEIRRMPIGLKGAYHDMPGWMEHAIKKRLIERFSRKPYYEYHNGTRPINSDVEKIVRQTFKANGWTEEPQFDGYIEEYVW